MAKKLDWGWVAIGAVTSVIVSAVLFPVFAKAKGGSVKGGMRSALRAAAQSLIMYSDEYGRLPGDDWTRVVRWPDAPGYDSALNAKLAGKPLASVENLERVVLLFPSLGPSVGGRDSLDTHGRDKRPAFAVTADGRAETLTTTNRGDLTFEPRFSGGVR